MATWSGKVHALMEFYRSLWYFLEKVDHSDLVLLRVAWSGNTHTLSLGLRLMKK